MNQATSDRLRNTPAAWRASAMKQLEALRVLKRGISISESPEEQHSALASAMMLAGFAFEVAFKCWYLESGNILYRAGRILPGFKGHSFTDWLRDSGFPTEQWEDEALAKAQYYSVAWGRYPYHNNANQELSFESLGIADVEQIENLIGRLLRL